jgi:hypothetical protein
MLGEEGKKETPTLEVQRKFLEKGKATVGNRQGKNQLFMVPEKLQWESHVAGVVSVWLGPL